MQNGGNYKETKNYNMASIFEQTIVPKVKFSNFPLSESQLVTCNFGQLIPVYLREVLPNDVFSLSSFADVQFAPMIAPMMQDVHASIHFFYVPNRIVFDDFETFITGSEEGHVVAESDLPAQPGVHPYWFNTKVGAENFQGSIFDYLGLPNELGSAEIDEGSDDPDLVISDIPLRGYFKIWYDYYRDENLQYELNAKGGRPVDLFKFWRAWRRQSDFLETPPVDLDPASVFDTYQPFYRAYRKDYFTGALQTPQKGEAVTLSLGLDAPVTMDFDDVRLSGNNNPTSANGNLVFGFSGPVLWNNDVAVVTDQQIGPDQSQGTLYELQDGHTLQFVQGKLTNYDGSSISGVANLRKASAITVESLREAFAVQEILESLSMRGSRYTEFLKGNFGVTPDDYKLQRPQFLGGIVTPVQVQQVLQNAGVDSDAGQLTAYAAGRAFAAAGDRVFRMRFKEHGYIIGIMSVMPKAYYYQGIPRHFMRRDRFDYYLPQTAHLGEQPIRNMELYFDPEDADKDKAIFGYIPRWAEYKISTNGIHGDFRGSLNYYHMARIFGRTPTLSEDFILTRNVQTRPFAVWKEQRPNINHLIWANLFFRVVGSRPMPYHSVPKVL